jgi:hypothetical protein
MPKVFHKPVKNTNHHQYKTETLERIFHPEAMPAPVVLHAKSAPKDLILCRLRELGSHKTRPQKVQ